MSTKLKDLLLEETERRVSLVALESHLAELSTKLSEAEAESGDSVV